MKTITSLLLCAILPAQIHDDSELRPGKPFRRGSPVSEGECILIDYDFSTVWGGSIQFAFGLSLAATHWPF
jgi:hypothetical protein